MVYLRKITNDNMEGRTIQHLINENIRNEFIRKKIFFELPEKQAKRSKVMYFEIFPSNDEHFQTFPPSFTDRLISIVSIQLEPQPWPIVPGHLRPSL